MNIKLDSFEVRVLGSLIEKEFTTPEYYPLTLNALTNACNQKSNREPIVSYDEKTVARALESLFEKKLAQRVTGGDSRVPKYQQVLTKNLELNSPQIAVMMVLMLRGPQTLGEIKSRTGRVYEFKDLEEVEMTLQSLEAVREFPLVQKLPRQTGMKESRYAHLLSDLPKIEVEQKSMKEESAFVEVQTELQRISKLEEEVKSLHKQFNDLKKQFSEFKKQFE
ncbi:MAG: YceH family protein [Ignavibacteria bacterium]|nr:YceH family protein [Ignavibacteria bacterium]